VRVGGVPVDATVLSAMSSNLPEWTGEWTGAPGPGTEAHAHLMLSVKSAPRAAGRQHPNRAFAGSAIGAAAVRVIWVARGPRRRGRAGPVAEPARGLVNRTVVILVAPPFGRHARARCVVVTRRGRHDRVTPGRPTHR